MRRVRDTALEQVLVRFEMCLCNPGGNCVSGQFGYFKLYRPPGFFLHDDRTRYDAITLSDVTDAQADQIATAQFAVDCKIEHSKFACTMFKLQSGADCPYFLEL